ncbi:MAG: class I SAM-dependent methyltransferase [Chitinophagales bacterium]|nr:class I SAM-dependent methyltransferase [Chitinophagales bacterium]
MKDSSTNNLPVQDIIEWDILNWSQLMAYWQPVLEQLPRDSKVLAIGERNGGLSLWLALMGYHVTCTDIDDITSTAGQLHARYNVSNKIEYRKLDIVNDKWPDEQYDIIIAKSVIGGVKAQRDNAGSRSFEVQRQAVNNILNMLKPGGYFLSAENMMGGWLTRSVRGVGKRASGWRYISYSELKELFNAFSLVQTKTFGILPTFFSRRVYNTTAYFLNRYLLDILSPATKYVAFTIARK